MLLAGVFLLSRSDDIKGLAESFPEKSPFIPYGTQFDPVMEPVKGTFNKFNKNLENLGSGLKTNGGSMMSNVMTGLKDLLPASPMKKLKETFFPPEKKGPVKPRPVVRPEAIPAPSPQPMVEALDENSGFVMNFFKDPEFGFGKRTIKNGPGDLLIFPNEKDPENLPFIE